MQTVLSTEAKFTKVIRAGGSRRAADYVARPDGPDGSR